MSDLPPPPPPAPPPAGPTGPADAPGSGDPASAPAPLPPVATARLAGARDRLFTSDLSVNEFALVTECGFKPTGLVMGTSMYHVGFQVQPWGQSQEIGVLTQAMYNARRLAVARMEAEADALGADGVMGVRLDIIAHAGAADMLEFVAVGTAVNAMTGGAWRTPTGRPFTSELSGQDFWTLVRTGHMPVSLVLGCCVYHIAHQPMRQLLGQTGQNIELPQYTQGLYDARELAMTRLQAEADQVRADGVIGARVVVSPHIWGEHAVEFLAIGTAVRSFPLEAPLPTPTMVLPATP